MLNINIGGIILKDSGILEISIYLIVECDFIV